MTQLDLQKLQGQYRLTLNSMLHEHTKPLRLYGQNETVNDILDILIPKIELLTIQYSARICGLDIPLIDKALITPIIIKDKIGFQIGMEFDEIEVEIV